MASLNEVNLIGHLGQDPESRFMPNGNAVCSFSLATSERWKDQQGQQQEKTEWHRIVMFGKVAEIAGQYLKKGSLVYLKGKLQTRKWTDQQGVERYTTEIVCHEMKMLGGKPDGAGAGTGQPAGARPAGQSPQQSAPQWGGQPQNPPTAQYNNPPPQDWDDEIPF